MNRLICVICAWTAGCTTLADSPPAHDPLYAARTGDLVRVVSWNIETVGTPGDLEYDAALAVLARLDADVVGIQEIAGSWDEPNLMELAADAGYGEVVLGTAGFGSDRVAILTRRTVLHSEVLDSVRMSGDAQAHDIARPAVLVEVETSGAPLVVVTGHWKCCGGDSSEFRRAVESLRIAQGLDPYDASLDAMVVLGDFNESPDDLPLTPDNFTSMPDGLPASYWLGQDLYDQLTQFGGIANDPLAPFTEAGMSRVDLEQRDGATDTYIAGGTLDLAYVSDALSLGGTEIFDDHDEPMWTTLHLSTPRIEAGNVEDASDHHPLVVEVIVEP